MTAHRASLINAAVLILCSLWAYVVSGSMTALIPAAFGVGIAACYSGVKVENKLIAHIAVLLALIVLLALTVPLRGALSRGDGMALLRVALMAGSCIFAMVYFVKSFRDARRAREIDQE